MEEKREGARAHCWEGKNAGRKKDVQGCQRFKMKHVPDAGEREIAGEKHCG